MPGAAKKARQPTTRSATRSGRCSACATCWGRSLARSRRPSCRTGSAARADVSSSAAAAGLSGLRADADLLVLSHAEASRAAAGRRPAAAPDPLGTPPRTSFAYPPRPPPPPRRPTRATSRRSSPTGRPTSSPSYPSFAPPCETPSTSSQRPPIARRAQADARETEDMPGRHRGQLHPHDYQCGSSPSSRRACAHIVDLMRPPPTPPSAIHHVREEGLLPRAPPFAEAELSHRTSLRRSRHGHLHAPRCCRTATTSASTCPRRSCVGFGAGKRVPVDGDRQRLHLRAPRSRVMGGQLPRRRRQGAPRGRRGRRRRGARGDARARRGAAHGRGARTTSRRPWRRQACATAFDALGLQPTARSTSGP